MSLIYSAKKEEFKVFGFKNSIQWGRREDENSEEIKWIFKKKHLWTAQLCYCCTKRQTHKMRKSYYLAHVQTNAKSALIFHTIPKKYRRFFFRFLFFVAVCRTTATLFSTLATVSVLYAAIASAGWCVAALSLCLSAVCLLVLIPFIYTSTVYGDSAIYSALSI